ncbi:hypothetical protein L596_004835 [Steinernema carpocapsae]|uniref:Lipid-binding serum glycoprotein N-terminal domain-containing protein n=1 Tax=Steinernema carpocapsae TaxID=34508 RepID=A0A4U8UYM5_STECR|nr:hypothetical protein L596_004835 [Steinernema carpocapsae]
MASKLCVFALLAALAAVVLSTAPGAELQINQRGLNAFAQVGVNLLNSRIPGMKIPDASSFTSEAIHWSWSLWDIKIDSFHVDQTRTGVSAVPSDKLNVHVSLMCRGGFSALCHSFKGRSEFRFADRRPQLQNFGQIPHQGEGRIHPRSQIRIYRVSRLIIPRLNHHSVPGLLELPPRPPWRLLRKPDTLTSPPSTVTPTWATSKSNSTADSSPRLSTYSATRSLTT